MIAKVQFKVVSVLRHKRARCSRTLEDPLRANVSPHMVVEQFLSSTSFIPKEVASVLQYIITRILRWIWTLCTCIATAFKDVETLTYTLYTYVNIIQTAN